MHAATGCQRLPLRTSEIEALATAKPTTVVATSNDASASSSPRKTAPPAASTPAASDVESAILGASDDAKPPAPAPVASAPPVATPLLDAAVARVDGGASAATAPVESPPSEGPVELPIVTETSAAPASQTADPPSEPLPPTAPAAKPAVPPQTPSELASAPAKPDEPVKLDEPSPGEDSPPTNAPTEPKAPKSEESPKEESAPVAKAKAKPSPEPEPAPKPIIADKPIEPIPTLPRDEWGDSLTRLRALARQRAGAPGDAAEAWGIRAHVLDWLAGEGDDPRNPTSPAWNRVLAALSTATTTETVDESALAHHLSAAVDTLESYAPLQIRTLALCRKIDGYGQYEPTEAHAGKPVLVYCELDGLRYEEDADGFRSRLASRVEIVPTSGGLRFGPRRAPRPRTIAAVAAATISPIANCICPRHSLPAQYTLRMTQTDLISGKSVASSLELRVSP